MLNAVIRTKDGKKVSIRSLYQYWNLITEYVGDDAGAFFWGVVEVFNTLKDLIDPENFEDRDIDEAILFLRDIEKEWEL